ncbi:MAG: hypothetical protein WD577_03425, partial [Bacteroidales bacterium]
MTLDEINQIGKFGAGFKSVFAVTNSPRIHSGSYHFEIKNFIVPYDIDNISGLDETIIILPFNKDEQDFYDLIEDTLVSLESESLLFLKNISEIKWKSDKSFGSYSLEIKDDFIKRINKKVRHQLHSDDYLVFSNTIQLGSAENLNLVVAYSLSEENGENKTRRITAYHDSKLFVFFPTSVNTGLKFLLHAPYKTTPNRETI